MVAGAPAEGRGVAGALVEGREVAGAPVEGKGVAGKSTYYWIFAFVSLLDLVWKGFAYFEILFISRTN